MSNIFAPIDSSNLSEVIPGGEDILYSTMCNVRVPAGQVTIKWKTHVLVTKSGFAYQSKLDPHKDKGKYMRYKERKKKMGLVAEFVPWEEFGDDIEKGPPFAKNRIVRILNKDAGILKRVMINFKDQRGAEFGHFCRDLWMDKMMK